MEHLPHVLLIGLPLLFCVALVMREWRREAPARPVKPQPTHRGLALALAACVLGSGLVHLSVIREHFDESTLLGVFFVLLAVAQIGVAVLVVVRPTRALLLAIALGQATVIALWAWTRLIGIPFGIAGGDREEVGGLDLAASGLELGCVLGAALLLRALAAPAPASQRTRS